MGIERAVRDATPTYVIGLRSAGATAMRMASDRTQGVGECVSQVAISESPDGAHAPRREYEKGVDRHKHVGATNIPEIVYVDGIPKYALGKCSRAIAREVKEELLNEAIPARNGDRDIDFPRRLHVVHEGAIYRAETTSAGKSYHAFPYAGKLGKSLLAELGTMADRKCCRKEFDAWVRKYIKIHGK